MDNIKIRQATTSDSDLNGIVKIYKPDDEAPWSKFGECKAWISKRLERGFYIRLAEIDGEIVGHGEWIISDEPDRKFLYLGMMEINEDYQRKGVGRAMIADGIEYAKKNNCGLVVTSPDTETGADLFYKKCGFINGRKQYLSHIKTEKYKDYIVEKTNLDKAPFSVIKEKKFIFGKGGQFSSRHMWEVMNEKPSTDTERKTPAILLPDGTYIQICYWGDDRKEDDSGFTLIWTNSEDYGGIIKSALSFGYSLGLNYLEFNYLEDEEIFLDGFDVYDKRASGDFEQIYYINNEIIIKPLGEFDLTEAAELIRASFATVAEDFNLTEQNCPQHTSFVTTPERLQNHLNWGWLIYGLYAGEKIAGYVSLSKLQENERAYELHNIAVLPDCRHKGYGKQLIDYCKAQVKELGGDKIVLSFIEENTVLKNWYAANGFVHTGTKKFEHLPFTSGYMEWQD